MYTPFEKTDKINSIDHMRISGTEPSSVILSKTKLFQKLESGVSDSLFESLLAAILKI